MDREARLLLWFAGSVLWVGFAIYNLIAVSRDLWVTLSDHPTLDEKTVAWQRWRDTLFRFLLASIFTFVAIANRETTEPEPEDVDSLLRTALLIAIQCLPWIGAVFEGWRIIDRKRMGAAYAALYRRHRHGPDTATGDDSSVHHGCNDSD